MISHRSSPFLRNVFDVRLRLVFSSPKPMRLEHPEGKAMASPSFFQNMRIWKHNGARGSSGVCTLASASASTSFETQASAPHISLQDLADYPRVGSAPKRTCGTTGISALQRASADTLRARGVSCSSCPGAGKAVATHGCVCSCDCVERFE